MATVGRRTRQSAPAFQIYEDPEDEESGPAAITAKQASRSTRSKRGLGGLTVRADDETSSSSAKGGRKRVGTARNTKRRKVVGAQKKSSRGVTSAGTASETATAAAATPSEPKAKAAAAKAKASEAKAKAVAAAAAAAAAVSASTAAAAAAQAADNGAAMQEATDPFSASVTATSEGNFGAAATAAAAAAPTAENEEAVVEQPRLRRRTRSSSSMAATAAAQAKASASNASANNASAIGVDDSSWGGGGSGAAATATSVQSHVALAGGSDIAVQPATLDAAANVLALATNANKPSAAAVTNTASHLAADAAAAPTDTAAMVPAVGSIAMAGAAANGLETRCPVGRMVAKLTLAGANGITPNNAAVSAVKGVLAEQAMVDVDKDFADFLVGAGWTGAGFNSEKDENLLLDRGKAHLKYSLEYVIPELELSRGYREREAYYMRGMENEAKGGLTDNMWSILVDWMIEVQINYELSQETLFLSIDILSRYIRAKQVARTDLQLIGAVSLLIASKYEEIYPPEVNSFVYICANTYSREALLTAERNVLLALEYKLSSPLAWHFLNWVGRRVKLNRDELHLAQFFLELTLQEREFTPFPRSLVAAAAINLACKIKRCDQDKVDHAVRESEYAEQEIVECAKQLNLLLQRYDPEDEQTHNGNCRRKYSDPQHDFAGSSLVEYCYYE